MYNPLYSPHHQAVKTDLNYVQSIIVDEWTGFTRHFTHLKSGDLAKDKNLLLTTILADAINLGLTKMAESCPGTTYAKLAWL